MKILIILHDAGRTHLISVDIDNLLCLFMSAVGEGDNAIHLTTKCEHREAPGHRIQLFVSVFAFEEPEVLILLVLGFYACYSLKIQQNTYNKIKTSLPRPYFL